MPTQQPFSITPIPICCDRIRKHRLSGGRSGPAAIFVHGVLVNGHLWDPLIERLAEAGGASRSTFWRTERRLPVLIRIYRSTPRRRCLPSSAAP